MYSQIECSQSDPQIQERIAQGNAQQRWLESEGWLAAGLPVEPYGERRGEEVC